MAGQTVLSPDTTYTVHLLSLKCLESHELDGDEISLKFNGRAVWSNGKLRMYPRPTTDDQIDRLDFVTGRAHGKNGWWHITSFNPANFIFNRMVGDTRFELWEHEPITGDAALARSPVSARDAGRGHISIVFARDGGRYVLTYEVKI